MQFNVEIQKDASRFTFRAFERMPQDLKGGIYFQYQDESGSEWKVIKNSPMIVIYKQVIRKGVWL